MNNIDSSEIISIIIPCYNAERWISEAIDSCLSQTYQNVEIIVVDDGSTDGSLAVIRSYGDKIKYLTGPNSGGSHARNRGIAIANGKYILFLDADDLIGPNTIKILIQCEQSWKGFLVTCDWFHAIQLNGQWEIKPSSHLPAENDRDYIRYWLQGYYIPCHAILWTRQLLEELGGWDESLSYNDDGDLVLRALINDIKIVYAQGGQAIYRHHESHKSVGKSLSSTAIKSGLQVLEKVEISLSNQGRLDTYAVPLGQAYHGLATISFGIDDTSARKALKRSKQLAGNQAITGTIFHRILCRTIGLERKEKLARALAKYGISRAIRKREGW